MEFSIPALLGYWADRRWGTEPWGVLVGAAIGFGVGFLGLLRIVRGGAAK
jgi:F0F1-type ATP synthase assembly protein I